MHELHSCLYYLKQYVLLYRGATFSIVLTTFVKKKKNKPPFAMVDRTAARWRSSPLSIIRGGSDGDARNSNDGGDLLICHDG